MTMDRFIYRGFVIVKHSDDKYVVEAEDKQEIGAGATLEEAQQFIDSHKRRGGK